MTVNVTVSPSLGVALYTVWVTARSVGGLATLNQPKVLPSSCELAGPIGICDASEPEALESCT
ncbi:MAG: hypothetical protein L0Z73_20245, partial [Gammaproteobacteria bacterium]|nr:hypothetical protein [Gammaproteobacteria bacterium]